MKHDRKTALVAIVAAGLIALGAVSAVAQDKPADNMQIVREKVRADKKLLVAANMELTETEAKLSGHCTRSTRTSFFFSAHEPRN